MASLIGQIAAVLVGAAVLGALLRRAGIALPFAPATAAIVVLLLGVIAVGNLRESWHALDLQRTHNEHVTSESGRSECIKVGIDNDAISWVAGRIPVRERYYVAFDHPLGSNGAICVRFLLLPRIQVARPYQAKYGVLWQNARPALVARLRRSGAHVDVFRGGGGLYGVVRVP